MRMMRTGGFTNMTPETVSVVALIFGGIATSFRRAKQRIHDWCIITEK